MENLIETLEMNGINSRGRIDGHRDFRKLQPFNGQYPNPSSSSKRMCRATASGFSLPHEKLGPHLFMNKLPGSMDTEKGRQPDRRRISFGSREAYWPNWEKKEKASIPSNYYLLKHKYGLSMLGWLHRAETIAVISEATAKTLGRTVRAPEGLGSKGAWESDRTGKNGKDDTHGFSRPGRKNHYGIKGIRTVETAA